MILFSHPADFTPVCTTEFMTFASMQDEFERPEHGVGGSVRGRSLQPHRLAADDQGRITFRGMADVEVTFPLIDDVGMAARKYGMIMPGGTPPRPSAQCS